MQIKLKKVHCDFCKKDHYVKEDVFFCPLCGSFLSDTGEVVTQEVENNERKEAIPLFGGKKVDSERHGDIVFLCGIKDNKKLLEKNFPSLIFRLLLSIGEALWFISLFLFRIDISNKTCLVDEWTVTTNSYEITKTLYFISEKTYHTIELLLVISFALLAMGLFGFGIRKTCLLQIVARKLNKNVDGVRYFEGLTKEEQCTINEKCYVNLFYSKIKAVNICEAGFLFILSAFSIIIAVITFLCFNSNYQSIVEFYIQAMRYDNVDMSAAIVKLFIIYIMFDALAVLFSVVRLINAIVIKNASRKAQQILDNNA